MKTRLSPSFAVAVLALVVASGGTGYAAAKVTSKQIKDGTIQSKDVKDGGLTGVDLADGSISTADLLDGTVTGTDVADGSLTGADVADGSLGAADLADGSVTGAELLDGSVTSADLLDGTVTGADIANGTVNSADIRDESVTGDDVEDGSLRGGDLANNSIGRAKLNRNCAAGEAQVFGGCVRRTPYPRSSHQAAVDACNRLGGRLPSVAELRWIATHDEFTWADGNPNNYEFTGEYVDTFPVTPIGLDASGYVVPNSSAQLFWHHCITY